MSLKSLITSEGPVYMTTCSESTTVPRVEGAVLKMAKQLERACPEGCRFSERWGPFVSSSFCPVFSSDKRTNVICVLV